jgi:hypothetical protein
MATLNETKFLPELGGGWRALCGISCHGALDCSTDVVWYSLLAEIRDRFTQDSEELRNGLFSGSALERRVSG